MTAYRKNRFSWRAFVSLYMTWAGIIMVVSGIILYLAPAGRIAKWTHIYILGLEKSDWQAIHTIFTFLTVIAGGFHLYFNWKPFVSYLKNKFSQSISLRKEFMTTTILSFAIFTLTIWNVPPFSTVMDFGEYLTDSWSSEQNEPPVPHAEEMTIAQLAEEIKQPAAQLTERLQKQGVNATETDVIKKLAEQYDLAPQELFEKMQLQKSASVSSMAGKGYGRMKLSEICQDLNLSLERALQRLEQKGIRAEGEIVLRDLSEKYDLMPIDILNIIQPETAQ